MRPALNVRDPRGRTPSQQVLGWRVATASRVFVLALATGQTLNARVFGEVGVLLAGLVILAAIACTLDIDSPPLLTRLIPVAEGALAAVLLSSTTGDVSTLLPYYIAPPLAAGIRAGWVTCLNSGLATLLALAGTWLSADSVGVHLDSIEASLPWLAVGVAAGLLASWQTRSLRKMEDAQAPYLAAHRLMTQLHVVSQQLSGGFDSETAGEAMVREIMTTGVAGRALLFVETADGSVSFLAGNDGAIPTEAESAAAAEATKVRRPSALDSASAFPVRVGEHDLGVVLVSGAAGVSDKDLAHTVTPIVESHSVPLDTALLFDDVREVATSEERQRLARDIHDGVAQDVASLGYAIDELSASSDDPEVREAAASLRAEVTRVVSELRHSIFDLRTERATDAELDQALREYAAEAALRSGLEAHVESEVTGPPLPARTQAELLRIVQEAVSNVRKHANADNVWIELTTDGRTFSLTISDDGQGAGVPEPRAGHYGLHTMRERAVRINASLELSARPAGGTSVQVRSSDGTSAPIPGNAPERNQS